MKTMFFAIKAEIRDPLADTFVFNENKTIQAGIHIARGDMIFIFSSENEGGPGLIASGNVTSIKAVAKKPGITGQTPRISITVKRSDRAKQHLNRTELKLFTDWKDGRPETELNFYFYCQATNKIADITEEATAFPREYFKSQ